ncbi:MAG: hypothetical protein U0359_14395 [Byssovorax sp.]
MKSAQTLPHFPRAMRLQRAALALLAPVALLACSKGGSGGTTGAASGAPAASGTPAAAGTGEAPAAAAAPGGKKIRVEIKDLQFFHPYSIARTMPAANEAENTYDTARYGSRFYGLGMIVEAVNDTGELLTDPTFEGVLTLTGGGYEQTCHFSSGMLFGEYGTRFLSYALRPSPDNGGTLGDKPPKFFWYDESGSMNEAPFRPAERVRMIARRNECESLVLGDMGVSAIHGKFTVKGRKRFVDGSAFEFDDKDYDIALDGGAVRIRHKASSRIVVVPLKDKDNRDTVLEMTTQADVAKDAKVVPLSKLKLARFVRVWESDTVESDPVEFDINPAAMTMQQIKLATGDFAHASGNLVVYLKDNKIMYDDMAKLKLSLHNVERQDIPADPPEVAFAQDELTGKVTDISMVHYTDEPTLPKGQRRLTVTWKINLNGDAIEGRLKASVDAAAAAYDAAEKEAVQADLTGDAPTKAKAKAALAKAKADKTGAETRFKTSLNGERGKLSKLLNCGDIKLATNRGIRAPSNGKAAADACKGLDKANDVDVTVQYTIDRYEIPVALTYSLGKTMTFSPIASAKLTKFDIR